MKGAAALLLPLLSAFVGASPADAADASSRWVEKTLRSLTIDEKAAQLVMVRGYALPRNPESEEARALRSEVRDLRVGGVIVFRSELDTLPGFEEALQREAKVPLWFAVDAERGLGMRVPVGPVSLPDAMAIGAIDAADPAEGERAARFAGELTARETRAAGIHWAFAPVADVNVDPANPIINLRSFGEDPERVGRLVAAFVEGARSGGLLTTAKHFPGHGDTSVDSHLELPTIAKEREALERVELAPFRAAVDAGVDSVMVGHLAVPALDPSGAAATLSSAMSTGVLRDELGFAGLVVTDAMDMRGVGGVWAGEAAVRAILAGSDVVLSPPDPRVAVQSIARAARAGRISADRLDASVRRVLAAKARLGLDRSTAVDRARLARDVARPEDVARADAVARRAITLVRDDGGLLPLRLEDPPRVLHLLSSSDWVNGNIGSGGGIVGEGLAARGVPVVTLRLGPRISPESADEVAAAARESDVVLVSAFVRVTSSKGNADLDPTHAALVERLVRDGAKVIVVSFGSPYLLAQLPRDATALLTFSPEESSQRAVPGALFGEEAIAGRLPVSIPGVVARGEGIPRPRRALELVPATTPEAVREAGFRPEGLADVDRVVERFVAEKAFPGAVLAIGRRGKLAHLAAFGRLSYDAGAPATTVDTIYDLASLTKVIVTTSVAMAMVDDGRLDLDARVDSFLPEFVGPGKEHVTVRHLLTHSAGIDWWAPLFETTRGAPAYVAKIAAMPLVYEPGTDSKYSDLGILLLGEILERVSGKPLARVARERIFAPLGLETTGYLPDAKLLSRIAPTELDAATRNAVHGIVHDENARALGGVAAHAGLFSTAPELARFVQMIAWKGVSGTRRLLGKATVEAFTKRQDLPPGSSRALGWDTKSEEGSSSGVLFSPDAFGHTGFTGTSIWVDPERELFVVLLTNRVHPTRENNAIRIARPEIHDAVIRALVDAPPVVRVGLDRVDAGEAPGLAGKRLGLLAHAAAVTVDGRRAVDVFRARGLDVVRLFSPEHGFAGAAAAGEKVADGTDPATGLPVVSLYGEHRKPSPEDLAGLDALVVDLQDAGVRFYTYESTLLLALEAAAEAGIELVVLDRPNPLGGEKIAGPALDPAKTSFLARAPGPLVHGLTLGELARFANARREKPARLTVVAMDGWKRDATWFATGRRWVAPSPNLRSASAALAYPGVALLEATNVSEGRGSDAPFLRFGAPWVDPGNPVFATIDAPGYRLEPTTFTPKASSIEPAPKFDGVACRGFAIHVENPALADPWRLGVELVRALATFPEFAWKNDGANLERLLGADRATVSRRTFDSEASAWRDARQAALLYD